MLVGRNIIYFANDVSIALISSLDKLTGFSPSLTSSCNAFELLLNDTILRF